MQGIDLRETCNEILCTFVIVKATVPECLNLRSTRALINSEFINGGNMDLPEMLRKYS